MYDYRIVFRIHHGHVSGVEGSAKQLLGQKILYLILNQPAQRPCSHHRVEALLPQMLAGSVGELHPHFLLFKLIANLLHHQVHYGQNLLWGELMEHHGGVDAVEELRTEEAFHLIHHLVLHPRIRALLALGIVRLDAESQRSFPLDQVRTKVAGHDYDRVAEVNPPASGVGQLAGVEYLKQDVEHLWMRLFYLVQQDAAVVLAPHSFGQLTALVVPHVTRRRSDQAGHRVPFLELGHVQPNHGIFIAEHELGQGTHQLSFTHTGGTQEHEHSDGPAWVLQASPRPANRLGDVHNCLILADDALVNLFLHIEQPLRLFLGQPGHRNARPHGDDFGYVFFGDHRPLIDAAFLPFLFQRIQLFIFLDFPVTQLGGRLVLLGGDRLILLFPHLLQDLHGFFDRCRSDAAPQPYTGGCFINQVYGLIRKEPVGNKARRQCGRGFDSFVGDIHLMVVFVMKLDAPQDLYRLFIAGLFHSDRLQAALQGRVSLHVFSIVVQRGGADTLEFTSGQGGFEYIGSVNRAFGRACSHNCVYLVDE